MYLNLSPKDLYIMKYYLLVELVGINLLPQEKIITGDLKMITIIEKTIQDTHIKLEVDETKSSKTIAGTPTLQIADDFRIIYPVDTLQIIKTIANAQTLNDLIIGSKGTWTDEQIQNTIEQVI